MYASTIHRKTALIDFYSFAIYDLTEWATDFSMNYEA